MTGGVSPPATQRVPLAPGASQSAQIWVKVGYQFDIDNARIYYTTDGSNPEGSFGTGRGTTQVITMSFDHTESQVDGVVDWWRGTIPGQPHLLQPVVPIGLVVTMFSVGGQQPERDVGVEGRSIRR